jgi:uncharacterized membrane protein
MKTVGNLILGILISRIMLTLIYRQQTLTQSGSILLQIVDIQIVIHIMYSCHKYK